MGRGSGSLVDIGSPATSFNDSLIKEALNGKLSRGKANIDERLTYNGEGGVMDQLESFLNVLPRDPASPERQATLGAMYGVETGVAILMSVEGFAPPTSLDFWEENGVGGFSAEEMILNFNETHNLNEVLERKRSNRGARETLLHTYNLYRDSKEPYLRAYAAGLASAAACLSGLDSGDPLQIIQESVNP
jgi:hypothetical protein